MWKKVVYICSILVVLLSLGFIIGILIFGGKKDNKNNNDKNDLLFEDQRLTEETSFLEAKISINTKINVSTYYDKCNHTEIENIALAQEMINMKEEEAKEYFESKGYSLIKFDTDEITLKQKKDEMCQNHFVIKYENENDVFLNIYQLDKNNELEFYKETDIAREFLTSIDDQTFKKGIEVYGYDNVESVLEDYE